MRGRIDKNAVIGGRREASTQRVGGFDQANNLAPSVPFQLELDRLTSLERFGRCLISDLKYHRYAWPPEPLYRVMRLILNSAVDVENECHPTNFFEISTAPQFTQSVKTYFCTKIYESYGCHTAAI
ncbi:MAG: hypothetical protein ACYDDO_03740 [Acidiferrobacterales bacterium]